MQYFNMTVKLGRLHFLWLLLSFISCFLLANYIYHSDLRLLSPTARETVTYDEIFQMLRYNRSQLPFAQKRNLGNFPQFQFRINSEICQRENEIDMLFLIGSHPSHDHLRNVFRQFFAHPGVSHRRFKVVFLFGHIQNQTQQTRLLEENQKYEDIVQGNFIDSYYNVSLRDLMGFRWAWQHCPQARFITRMDDDVAINVYTLSNTLNQCCSNMLAFIGCYIVWQQAPVRREGRYGLTPEEHLANTFDDYCAGWMYVITPLTAYLLDWATEHTPYYWMNDAYITGSLVKVLGLKHLILNVSNTDNIQMMKKMFKISNITYTIGPTDGNVDFTRALLQFYYNNRR